MVENNTYNQLHALSVLVSRASLATKLGYEYGGDRNLYTALGYQISLTYADYTAQYLRHDMAHAVIDRPVKATWRGEFEIIETEDAKETEFEKAWVDLNRKLKLVSKFIRLDKLSSIGKYGILLLGLDDVKTTEDFSKPVNVGNRRLLYVKPLGEDSAKIDTYEQDSGNERYSLPVIYSVEITNPGGTTSSTIRVHHSRIIHVTGELLESEVEGEPYLQAIFNRLKDLEKLVGSSAEMFWRGARPGYHGKVDPEFQLTPNTKEDLQNQVDEYEHGLRRFLINEGIDLSSLAPQVSDPGPHVDVQIQMISAITGIPKRILTGSERGELASTEDRSAWFELIQSRREEYAEPQIVRLFIDRCIEYGVLPLPKTKNYSIQWTDLFSLSEKERTEIGKNRALALQAYTATPTGEAVVPPEAFYRFFLGLNEDQIELINEMQKQAIAEEEVAGNGETEDNVNAAEDE